MKHLAISLPAIHAARTPCILGIAGRPDTTSLRSFDLQTTMRPTSPHPHGPQQRPKRHSPPVKRPHRIAWAAGILGLTTATLMTTTSGAQAQPIDIGGGSYSLKFDRNLGRVAPAGEPEWLQAIISPIDGGVNIELINKLKSEAEFISKVGFNLTEEIQNLSSTCINSDAISCSANMVTQKFNAPSPVINFFNEAKGFDLAIDLPTRGNQNRFSQGEAINFQLFGTNLKTTLFLSTNEPVGPGSLDGLWSAAKVQGLRGGGSTTIVDPPSAVPGPLPLLGAGVALGFSRRLRRRIAVSSAAA